MLNDAGKDLDKLIFKKTPIYHRVFKVLLDIAAVKGTRFDFTLSELADKSSWLDRGNTITPNKKTIKSVLEFLIEQGIKVEGNARSTTIFLYKIISCSEKTMQKGNDEFALELQEPKRIIPARKIWRLWNDLSQNNKAIVYHRNFPPPKVRTTTYQKALKTLIGNGYRADEIEEAIRTYAEITSSEDYFYDYRYPSITSFLLGGFEHFRIRENAINNFARGIKKGKSNGKKQSGDDGRESNDALFGIDRKTVHKLLS